MKEFLEVPTVAPRAPASHKGTFGHVLILGGSLGMTGAAALAAEAAMRAGAGLVTCACPGHVNPILEVKLTEAMTWPLPVDAAGCLAGDALRVLNAGRDRFNAAAVGPGLGRHPTTLGFVRSFLTDVSFPVVVDADALGVFAEGLEVGPAMILTPHPGEFGRMIGVEAREVQESRQERACAFAQEHAGVLVLKGHETIVAEEGRFYVNRTGNPGMATGGSGDVLSGIIAALFAQGLEPFAAACLGVWLHGRAGDLACSVLGEESVLAGDLIHFLPEAIRERKDRRG
jgi:NAD(P)H-hydrate epimerase